MLRRPSFGETEENILALQAEFEVEKQKSSYRPIVNIVNPRKHKADEEQQEEQEDSTKLSEGEVDDVVNFPKHTTPLLGDIVEKNVTHAGRAKAGTSTKSNSVYAKRLRNEKTQRNLPNDTFVLKGDNAKQIHDENVELLKTMSEEEILKEQQHLLKTVSPETVSFLKSLRAKSKDSQKAIDSNLNREIPSAANSSGMEADVVLEDLLDNEVFSHPRLCDWVNFNVFEKDKVEWMKSFKSENLGEKREEYEARFNFQGYLLPYTMEYTERTKTLFHHAEEPERPGYTLKELFQLCRSTVTQQRTTALNALAGLLDYHGVGIYDGVLDIPTTKIFFVLRFALDENVPAVYEPSLRALRNLFYNRIDEFCLSNTLCYEICQPEIKSTRTEMEENEADVEELKDFHLADLDLIQGCIRTDILLRLRYILTQLNPNHKCVQYCLQILTRIARHSHESAERILKIEGLIDYVFQKFLPSFMINHQSAEANAEQYIVISETLKLLRILVCQSLSFAKMLNFKFNIVDTVARYLTDVSINTTYFMKLQIEACNLYATLLTFRIGVDNMKSIASLLLMTLSNRVDSLDISLNAPTIMYKHTTSLLHLLQTYIVNSLLHSADVEKMDKLLYGALMKWTTQLCFLEKSSFISLNLLATAFNCLIALSKRGYYSSFNDTNLKSCIRKMLQSNGFATIASNLTKCSNFLSKDLVYKNPNGINVGKLDTVIYERPDKLIPVVRETSPIGFLSTLFDYFSLIKNDSLSLEILNDSRIVEYLYDISSKSVFNLQDNWFTIFEMRLLCNLLRLSINALVDEDKRDSLFKLCYKLTYLLPSHFTVELKMLFTDVIFNKKWFTTDRLLKNLSIDETTGDIDAIQKFYIDALNLDIDNFKSDLIINDWNRATLPKDWPYMPILAVYNKQNDLTRKNNVKLDSEITFNIINNSLRWILTLETCCPDIMCEISLTDRFCRLMCVFLADNSIFLDSNVKALLQKYVKIIFDLEKRDKLDFDKPITGINFQDLYVQFVDHFQAVSYGDWTFAACVLVPLSQKHSIKWRKLVWSEYANCLRFLDCPEDMLCQKLDDYLTPAETDVSLLKCYFRALNGNLLRSGTVPHKIASHHVECAKNRKQKNTEKT